MEVPCGWSLTYDGQESNDDSAGASISANGQYVTFWSQASNLVSGDTNDFCDMDKDGIAEENCPDIFVVDRSTGEIRRVSMNADYEQGNSASLAPMISADGRFISYHAFASNLIPNDDNNNCNEDELFGDNCSDIFVFNNHLIQREFPITVNPTNDVPIVTIIQPQPVAYEGDQVLYTGSVYDPDPGDSQTTSWDFGDGGTSSAITDTQHVFLDDGDYIVKYSAVDLADAVGFTQVNQKINNVPPYVDVGDGLYLQVGEAITRTGSVQDPGLDTFSGTVDYGDGKGSYDLDIQNDRTFTLNFEYNQPGIYRVRVIIQDDDGGIGIDTLRVFVGRLTFLPLLNFNP